MTDRLVSTDRRAMPRRIMQKLEIATLLAFFAVVSPSLANSDGDRLREAGLLGSWAVDCNAPPSKTNPYQVLAPSPDGSPTRTLQVNDPRIDETVTIREVRSIARGRIGLTWTDRDGDTFRMVLLKDGNRHKGFNSVRASDGKVFVKGGRFVNSGRDTPWFTKCGASSK